MKKTIILSLSLFITGISFGQKNDKKIKMLSDQVEQKVIEWRRHVHQNPELSNREFKTAKYIESHLRALGMTVQTGVAKTGVVGILKGEKPGKVVALRADIDALPVTERNELLFKSNVTTTYNGKETGVMHACGHDSHVAILMGVAEVLSQMKSDIHGTIKFIFQPAEEGHAGAKGMITDGCLEDNKGLGPHVDEIYGLHLWSCKLVLQYLYYNIYKWYITAAKDLRQLIEMAREPLVRWLVPQVGTVSEAERRTDELLRVSEIDLEKCDNINVDTEGYLTDEEINLAIKTGYFEMRQQAAIERGLLSPRTTEVLTQVVLPLLVNQTPTTPDELISESNKFLNASRNCSPCTQFWQQLSQWSHRLELIPNDHAVASATATALGALATCLHNQQVISEEEFSHIQNICWRVHGER